LVDKGLRYLGEAQFPVMVAGTSFSTEVQRELDELAPNIIEKEQYMDFMRNRFFRQTLVYHKNIRPNYDVRSEQLTGFFVASPANPTVQTPVLISETPEEFEGQKGMTVTVSVPIVKAALVHLGEVWPKAVAFDTLRTRARARLTSPLPDDPAAARQDTLALSKALLTA